MMINSIKQAAMDAVLASNPVNVCFGEVLNDSPLEVSVDQRFTLTADFLIVPERLTAYEVDLRHAHSYSQGTTGDALTQPVIIRRGLEKGDKLILLRMQGGQQYVILDRLVSP